ncbi:MAG: hypothetical protein FRX49_07149 [Trebouxia sp. A1-2]|nr:MAG: hypothetical protein FRX49_07149 [Trebouxia sp. A1-2]
MGNRAAKPAGGPPPPEGGAPNSAATGCMAIPQRFCGTCFHCIAVGFGFTLGGDAANALVQAI